MTEPTHEEIEQVSVAIAMSEMRRVGAPAALLEVAERFGRKEAVNAWGDIARVAITTICDLRRPA